MIVRLFSPLTTDAVFSAAELPEAVHGTVLQDRMVPRVASWSMAPTLQKGDRLELGSADALQAGDIVVFRQDRLLICHRIEQIERQRVYTRGDANDGPPEQISARDVVGRVTAILRDGRRLAVPSRPHTLDHATRHSTLDRYALWSQERGRSLALQLIESVVALPLAGLGIRSALGNVATIDVMERTPLQSITSYVKRQSFRLCHTDRLQKYLSGLETDPRHITLVIRAGPLDLGTCTLTPWSLQIRPLAAAVGLEIPLQILRPLPETSEPLVSPFPLD